MESERLHPFTVVFAAIRIGRGFIVPALGGGLAAGFGDLGRVAVWGLIFLSVPALAAAVARYLSFRYSVTEDELILDSGVLVRRRRVIPLARVQNIDKRRSALQRLCGVAELRVETAGGETTEAVLDVLADPAAEALRTELLARRRRALALEDAEERTEAPAPSGERLARLSTGDLALAGATANEAGLIAALLAGGIQGLYQLPIELPVPEVQPGPWLEELQLMGVALLVGGLVLLFLFLGWVLSILGAVVGYHDFTLERAGEELRKRYGLLGRREADIPLERVQAMRVEESLLRRPLGLATLKVATAGAGPGGAAHRGAETFLPLARREEVSGLVAAVFPDLAYDRLDFRPVHPRARRRAFIRYAAPLLGAAALLGWAVSSHAYWLAALLPAAYLAAHLHYRHLAYGLARGYVVARSGFWNRITWVVPDRKIQTVHLVESPFQRRHGLASLVVDTAAGGALREARIVDLGRSRGVALLLEGARRAARAGRSGSEFGPGPREAPGGSGVAGVGPPP